MIWNLDNYMAELGFGEKVKGSDTIDLTTNPIVGLWPH